MRWTPVLISTLLALSPVLCGCTRQARVEAETQVAKALVSDEQLNELGKKMHQELEQQGTQFVDDPAITSYVQGIAGKIFQAAKKDNPNAEWQVFIIKDAKTVNAFATPAGYIYVTTALLATADNTAEVAGVLGHESGHVAARHIARQMVAQVGMETVAKLALGNEPSTLAQLTTTLLGKGALLAYSRSEESEADEYGVKYTTATGFDPRGLVTFFQKLKSQEGNQPALLAFLSTHPATEDRIQRVQKLISQVRPAGGTVGQEEHQQIKQRILAIQGGPAGAGQGPGQRPGQTPGQGGGRGGQPTPGTPRGGQGAPESPGAPRTADQPTIPEDQPTPIRS